MWAGGVRPWEGRGHEFLCAKCLYSTQLYPWVYVLPVITPSNGSGYLGEEMEGDSPPWEETSPKAQLRSSASSISSFDVAPSAATSHLWPLRSNLIGNHNRTQLRRTHWGEAFLHCSKFWETALLGTNTVDVFHVILARDEQTQSYS